MPDDESPEVGGLQNTMTNLGASLGTALAGSLLIATPTSAFLTNIQQSSAIPASAKSIAQVELAGGVPFVSDADRETALERRAAPADATDAALDAYSDAPSLGPPLRPCDPRRTRDPRPVPGAEHPEETAGRRGKGGRDVRRWLAYSGSPIRLRSCSSSETAR